MKRRFSRFRRIRIFSTSSGYRDIRCKPRLFPRCLWKSVSAWGKKYLKFFTVPWLMRWSGNGQSLKHLDLMTRILQTKPPVLPLAIAANTWRTHTALVRAIERHDIEDAQYWMRYHNHRGLAFVLASQGDPQ